MLPPVAVLPHWARTTDARRWICVWCLAFFLSDVIQIVLLFTQGNNLWVFTYVEPVEDALLLWALSHWQTRPVAKLAMRIAIPLVVGTYVAISFAAGEESTFRIFSGPFRALVMMVWTALTLLTNLAKTPERVWENDWLWTTLGVLLYFGLLVAIDPVVGAMEGPNQMENMRLVYNVRSVGDVFAFILIWRGMRCPLPSNSSGST